MHPNLQLWIACNVRACAVMLGRNGGDVGSGFRVVSPHVPIWKPRALIETDLLINKAVDRRLSKEKAIVIVPQRKNKSVKLNGPCAYGCPTTTHIDDKGVCRWQRPPQAMRHILGPNEVVCQRCYTLLARGMLPKTSNPANNHERPPGQDGAKGAQDS